jgi:nucleolar protein 4
MASILTPDPSAPSAQSLVLHGRTLDVVRAVTREEAGKLKDAHEKAREKADKRNMYLLREGGELCLRYLFCNKNLNPPSVILPNTPAAESLSATEVQKRADSYSARRSLLASNPSLYVSKTRLSIRNMPTFVTERMLKRLATHAMQAFDNEVAAGSRTGLSEEELESARDEPVSGADESRNKGGPTPRVRQAKIIRQADRVDPLTGKGRSKGYGFLELREHADALRVLRWTNNNPDVPSLLAEWWPAELEIEKKKGAADPSRAKKIAETPENHGGGTKHSRGALIVEFSIENVQVVQRRTARQNVVSPTRMHIVDDVKSLIHLGQCWGEEEVTLIRKQGWSPREKAKNRSRRIFQ